MRTFFERLGWLGACFAWVVAAQACAKPSPPDDESRLTEAAAQATHVAAPHAALHRGVGAVVPGQDALRWAERHARRHPDELRSVFFGRDAFELAVRRDGAEGVSIQLALNDAGAPTLVLVPLDRGGARLPDEEARAAITNDPTGFFVVDDGQKCPPDCPPDNENAVTLLHRGIGAPIASATAERWTRAYQRLHPGGLRSVFFGREVLERLLEQPGCEGVSIQRAIDDRDRETFALMPLDHNGAYLPGEDSLGGALRGNEATPFAVDDGDPCPNNCPPEETSRSRPSDAPAAR
jgi:hypothetical protein